MIENSKRLKIQLIKDSSTPRNSNRLQEVIAEES